MKCIQWDEQKNQQLLRERGVSFDIVAQCIKNGDLLGNIPHPNSIKYPHQRMFVIRIDGYVYAVPFVEDNEKVFLKTVIPDRKLTRKYSKK